MQKNAYAGGLTLLAIGLIDAWLKVYALQHFPEEQTAPLAAFFSLAVHKNPGIIFDIPLPFWFTAPITLILIIILLAMTRRGIVQKEALLFLGAWSAIVGATNNFFDRLINGFTTDYLIFFRLSAINLSDVLICLGIALLLCYRPTNSRAQQN